MSIYKGTKKNDMFFSGEREMVFKKGVSVESVIS